MNKQSDLLPVLYIADSTLFGGAEQYLVDVAANFSQSREVKVGIIGPGNLKLEQNLASQGVEVLKLSNSFMNLLYNLWRYRRWVWHLNLTYYDSCRKVQMINAILPGVKCAATIHTLVDACSSLSSKLKRLVKVLVFNQIDRVIAPSAYIADKLIEQYRYPKDKVEVVHNGVRGASFDKNVKSNQSSVPIIISTGRLHPDKGHHYLLQALDQVKEDGIGFKCRIVGDGDLRKQLENEARELRLTQQVEFLGFRNDVDMLLKQSDIFVLPSLPESENFPLSILEAMSAGLPVVATNVGGVSEQIDDGESGILIDPGNSEQLANELKRLLADEKVRKNMGVEGYARFRRDFSSSVMMHNLEQVYAGLKSYLQ